MNKFMLAGCFGILAASMTFVSCGDNDDNKDDGGKTNSGYVWSTNGGLRAVDHILFTEKDGDPQKAEENPEGTQIGTGEKELVFTGKQTLKKGTYLLKGWIYIADGAELKIEPGTIIKGDKETDACLVAERGGKLIAQGTKDAPIVFTSEMPAGQRKPGDWGGVILCGKAPNNKNNDIQIEGGPRTHHGGTDAADNSGVVSYVRIEFAGTPLSTEANSEINGLTLGSVGSGTKIDHVQVSYSGDDSYEWFGGTVNCKNLIAYRGWDDDFDTDNGFSGHVQFGLSVRDPKLADQSQSNGFESDNNADGSASDPHTAVVFSNMTFVGPRVYDATFDYANNKVSGEGMTGNGIETGKFQSAMQIRRDSHLSCFNSVATGWPVGLILDGEKGNTQDAASKGTLKLQNVWFADMGVTGSDGNKKYADTFYDWTAKKEDATKKSFSSTWFLAQTGNKAVAKADAASWFTAWGQWLPSATSPLLSGASFTDALLSSGFDKVEYIGAFKAGDDWADGWTNWDPENAPY